MSDELILLERSDACLTITINRPTKANSLTRAMLRMLADALYDAANDKDLRVAYLTGAGERVFSGGADLNELNSDIINGQQLWQAVSEGIRAMPMLTMALINGPCMGGGLSLALGCDIRLAVPEARFHYPVLKNNVVPGQYDIDSLVSLIGPGNASTLLLTGGTITAQEALQWGMVEQLVPRETLFASARELATTALSCESTHLFKLKSMIKESSS